MKSPPSSHELGSGVYPRSLYFLLYSCESFFPNSGEGFSAGPRCPFENNGFQCRFRDALETFGFGFNIAAVTCLRAAIVIDLPIHDRRTSAGSHAGVRLALQP